jgi:putative selenium metabolism protein SsnA
VEGGVIAERGWGLSEGLSDEICELRGKLLLPGLVCAHHHLYTALARGMPGAESPEKLLRGGEGVQGRLAGALDAESIELSAKIGSLDAICAGTTTIFDHHASPNALQGSLARVARGMGEVGIRGVLCHEVTDRHGAGKRAEAIEENVAFAQEARGPFRGMIGADASFTLSDDALDGIRNAMERTGAGLHIHLAEHVEDERLSIERHRQSPVQRLIERQLLGPRSILADAVHLSWPDLSQVISTGSWLVHNPRSNMNNQVGYAPAGKFGPRATLGTDGMAADMFAEAQTAYFRSREAGQPIDVLKYLANAQRLASELFQIPIGAIQPGAAADIIVLDYPSPMPLSADNLAAHFLFGFSARFVESVMIDGIWRMRERRPLCVSAQDLARQARESAAAVWERMERA